ncbi:FAD:protein FMN transferase [Streptomyces sp. NPDC057445]|uniref:FAD:protein FMN transferase n=1 Tax=Streptomyces sp. NPDC057445 TaxID=3346136 RepID=UPI00369CF185
MPEPDCLRHVEHVMGTVFSFDIRADATPGIVRALADAVAWLHHVDAVFSTYRPDSQISRLGRGATTLAECDPEVGEVLGLCQDTSRLSGGRFTAHPGGRLDPSAMVKGWAVERASRMLYDAGARHHTVNGGGDIQCRGRPAPGRSWRIGIAHPFHRDDLTTVVVGQDLAVATSGTAERGCHIIDPVTGGPATGLASITLVGRHLTQVDVLATAAFAMGDAAGAWVRSLEGVEAFAVTSGGRLWWTPGFAAYSSGSNAYGTGLAAYGPARGDRAAHGPVADGFRPGHLLPRHGRSQGD